MTFHTNAVGGNNAGGRFAGKATSVVLAATLAVSAFVAPASAFADDEDEQKKRAAMAIEAVEEQATEEAAASEAPAAPEPEDESAGEAPAMQPEADKAQGNAAESSSSASQQAAPQQPASQQQTSQKASSAATSTSASTATQQAWVERPQGIISATVPLDQTGNPEPVNVTPEEIAEESAAWEDVTPEWSWPLTEDGWIAWDGTPVKDAVRKGIDVSQHQGQINWEVVKEQGIDFAIIRCGYGSDEADQDDARWEYNVSECERLGIPYGVYLYSYADSVEAAASEAAHVLRLLEGHKPDLPVYYDLEESFQALTDIRNYLPAMAATFCDTIKDAGYQPGVYANLYWWSHYLTNPMFDNWEKWVAQYNTACDYTGSYKVWQSSSKMTLDGVTSQYVDVDFDLGGYYRDVDYSAEYCTSGALDYVTQNDIMSNVETMFQFMPEKSMTRAEAVEVFYNLAGRPDTGFEGIGNPNLNVLPFDDVDMEASFTPAVRWARSIGLLDEMSTTSEESDNVFGPDTPITRVETCQMAAAYASYVGSTIPYNPINLITLADGFSIERNDIPPVGWSVGTGILPLESEDDIKLINPAGEVSRATMAQVLHALNAVIESSAQ